MSQIVVCEQKGSKLLSDKISCGPLDFDQDTFNELPVEWSEVSNFQVQNTRLYIYAHECNSSETFKAEPYCTDFEKRIYVLDENANKTFLVRALLKDSSIEDLNLAYSNPMVRVYEVL
ncbi:MAG: hypothetical protein GOV15_03265 [Candidatus Diapherotrites archaeon]|nr:hypothetical protein [Candidatus Diapherotrites archaeon]